MAIFINIKQATNTILFVLYAFFVTYISLRSMDNIPISGQWDKVGHIGLYCLFAILAYHVTNRARYYYLCLGIVAYSGLMEVAQSFMPGRMMSAGDLLANAVGVMLGVIMANRAFREK